MFTIIDVISVFVYNSKQKITCLNPSNSVYIEKQIILNKIEKIEKILKR